MSYPDVTIFNATNFMVSGTVHYRSALCSNDDYTVTPGTPWSHSRGLCLITKIDGTVLTPQGKFEATPYESSGTSYSEYAIISTGPNSFEITRRVTGAEDEPPADYEEPTTKQK
jgi:hypothetical protein